MATDVRPKKDDEETRRSRDQFVAKIGKQVMEGLGHPRDFQRVHVQSLWDDRYRANVMIGSNSVFYASNEALLVDLLREHAHRRQVRSWKGLQEILKSFMWIALLDDQSGKQVYDLLYLT